MRAEAEDVHCDSLAGAELAPALSIPPSLRPSARSQTWWLRTGGLTAGVLALAVTGAHLRARPEPEQAEALQVEGQRLSFSERFAERAGIHTVQVKEASFSPVVTASGKATLEPDSVASVGANALGTVRRVLKYEGESVKRGDVLAEIGSPGLARMEAASFLRARQAPGVGAALGVSLVRSPLEGTVIERRVVTGQSVKGERVVFVVANLEHLALDLQVDEREARAVRLSDHVELNRDATGARIEGQVTHIGNAAGNDNSGAPLLVRVSVDNRAHQLRPGQAVSAKIYASGGAPALVIPSRAVAWIAGHPAVFIESGHNAVNAWPVTLGGCNGDQTKVSVGLAPGQRIVSDGVGVLKDESFL